MCCYDYMRRDSRKPYLKRAVHSARNVALPARPGMLCSDRATGRLIEGGELLQLVPSPSRLPRTVQRSEARA
jgi:hypothetical protein